MQEHFQVDNGNVQGRGSTTDDEVRQAWDQLSSESRSYALSEYADLYSYLDALGISARGPLNAEGEFHTTLKGLGYTPARWARDYEITFPEQLVRGQDYDYTVMDGDLVILVYPGAAERWKNAVQNSGRAAAGFTYFPFGAQKNYYLAGQFGTERLTALAGEYETAFADPYYQPMHYSNRLQLAAVNESHGWRTISGSPGTDEMQMMWALQMANGDVQKYYLDTRVVIAPEEGFQYSDPTDEITETAAWQITAEPGGGWAARTEDGLVRLYPVAGTVEDAVGAEATITVAPPEEGYAVAGGPVSVSGGNAVIGYGTPFFLVGSYNSENYTIIWQKAGSERIVQSLTVTVCERTCTYSYLQNAAPVTAYHLEIGGKPATFTDLAGLGVEASYDAGTGYFRAEVSRERLAAVEAVQAVLVPEAPEGAVSFRVLQQGGSESPFEHREGYANDAQRMLDQKSGTPVAQAAEMLAVPLFSLRQMALPSSGRNACFADDQTYRNTVIQWLDGEGQILATHYLFGRNGDVVLVQPADVTATVTEKVDAPTIVDGEGGSFGCWRYPQDVGDCLLYDLNTDVADGTAKDIYLPYGDFGMENVTYTEGKMPAVTVYHYNPDLTVRETIQGECTPYGIRFTTKTFSPFAVDVDLQRGNLNRGELDVSDMAALFTYLATGEIENETLSQTPTLFDVIADVNYDGAVNILDYQALYEVLKNMA